jgi:hypothetical protein
MHIQSSVHGTNNTRRLTDPSKLTLVNAHGPILPWSSDFCSVAPQTSTTGIASDLPPASISQKQGTNYTKNELLDYLIYQEYVMKWEAVVSPLAELLALEIEPEHEPAFVPVPWPLLGLGLGLDSAALRTDSSVQEAALLFSFLCLCQFPLAPLAKIQFPAPALQQDDVAVVHHCRDAP